MDPYRIASLLMAGGLLACTSHAHPLCLPETPGSLVSVSVEVDGQSSPLYAAPDGSGRFYLEARSGSRYSITLANRGAERLGVVLTADGLNVISGERDQGRGRMYVLDPWQTTTVQGWRTSLREVRQFTFVDEHASYAARSGKANEKMGWIEVAVFRERRPFVRAVPRVQTPAPLPAEPARDRVEGGVRFGSAGAPDAPTAKAESNEAQAPAASGMARSYPGTGWGERTKDPVVLVSFDPETSPSECVTLRYEYRRALVALGVLPRFVPSRDRLWERDHAEAGFAQPPRW
jgi:hypothetical protein